MKLLKTKSSGILAITGMVLLAAGCNRHHEPPIETVLPVNEVFVPASVTYDRTDTEFRDLCREWNDKEIAVNDVSGLPDDPIGFTDSYRNINFSDQTLLLTYRMHLFDIDSYRVRYVRNNIEHTYDWNIAIGSGNYDDSDERTTGTFTRFALLVPKLPADAQWRVWWSYRDFSWDWDEE